MATEFFLGDRHGGKDLFFRWLALDGGALGPLFNTATTYHPNTDEHHHDDDTARADRRG